jgi:hypothetical protein
MDGSEIKKKWNPQCTSRCVVSDKFAGMHTIMYQANQQTDLKQERQCT